MRTIRSSGNHKVLGILGGMGPKATLDFYGRVIELTPAQHDQEHIPTIIHSNTETPNRNESILKGSHDSLPYLVDGVVFLEHGGADVIVIPCNTAHYYIGDLRAGVRIPILSIIEETVLAIQASQSVPDCVGILATDGTKAMNLYGEELKKAGISYIYPKNDFQAKVMQLIDGVKSGNLVNSGAVLGKIERHCISAGAQALILGCTELPLAARSCQLQLPVFNPNAILAASTVALCLAQ